MSFSARLQGRPCVHISACEDDFLTDQRRNPRQRSCFGFVCTASCGYNAPALDYPGPIAIKISCSWDGEEGGLMGHEIGIDAVDF